MLRIYIYALTLLLCANAHAQLMPFKNYGIKDGLNDNNVQAVVRDDRGLLWVGTDFGVYWFDGKRFYQPEIKTNIGQLYINDFYKDWNGDIWVLTFFNGLYKYHNGRFTNYLIDTLLKDALTNTISGMEQISADKYIVLCQAAAYLFDGKRFSIFDSSNAFLKSSTNSATHLPDQTILLSTNQGISLYTPQNGKLQFAGHVLKSRAVYKILVTEKRLFVVTDTGLLSYRYAGARTFSDSCNYYLPGKAVKDVAVDIEGRVWALADTVYKIDNGKITKYTNKNGLQENILRIYCDNKGLVWFSSWKGISMLGDEYYEFTTVKNGKTEWDVGSVNTDPENNIWIGSDNGLAMKKDVGYSFFSNARKDIIGYVTCLHKNKNGTLLAATNAGVISINENSVKKEFHIHPTIITDDDAERIWFGDNNGNIWVYDGKRLKVLHTDHFNAEMITSMYAQNENVWVGYRSTGVRIYKYYKDSLLLLKEYNSANGFNDFRIRCCVADKKGNIIFGTRTNGIFIFSVASDSLVAHISAQNGLNANWIKGMMCDTDRKLYLATNNGINIIAGDYNHPTFKQFKINNENINRETNNIAKIGNEFYIGTIEGVLKWMPGKVHKDTVAPPVYFTHIDIQGRKNFSVDPYTENVGDITLPYEQHFISFEFAGISLKDPENLTYKYMLEGQSNEWSPPTKYNYVAYNLKPGNYTFKVIAENADSVISRRPAVFHFIIQPPFWNTWWFIMASILAVLAVAYGLYRYKVSQLLELESLRNKISTDLHDDMGSTLSSISILSNMAMKESSDPLVREMIKGISENSTSLLEKMDDIVWSINPKNDSLENLIIRFRRFASLLLEAKNIEYSIDIEASVKSIKLSMDYRQHIYMILKEAINNLVKYSRCTKAYIGVTYNNSCLEIMVNDNGVGFDPSAKQYGNGIINMQQRAKQMHAAISISSREGEGTKISLRLKIK